MYRHSPCNRTNRTASLAISCLLEKKKNSRVRFTLHYEQRISDDVLFFLSRLSSGSLIEFLSWIDGSSMQTRPAGDHFTAISWKNNELSLNFANPCPFRAAIATDLYALARGVKLTARVGKPATLRANQ